MVEDESSENISNGRERVKDVLLLPLPSAVNEVRFNFWLFGTNTKDVLCNTKLVLRSLPEPGSGGSTSGASRTGVSWIGMRIT